MAVENASVSWVANTEPDLAGYRVYYGQYPGLYNGYVQVGFVTNTVIANPTLNNDGTWYFAVSAFDTSNNESALSSVVSKRVVRTQSRLRRSK